MLPVSKWRGSYVYLSYVFCCTNEPSEALFIMHWNGVVVKTLYEQYLTLVLYNQYIKQELVNVLKQWYFEMTKKSFVKTEGFK